jgi:hypothetical protein
MSQKTLKQMVAGVLVFGAVGAMILRVARATPPHGVINTLIAGPATFVEIHAITLDPDYTDLVKTRGSPTAISDTSRSRPGATPAGTRTRG